MIFYNWAKRHGVSLEAVNELVQLITANEDYLAPLRQVQDTYSEGANQNATRIDAARKGVHLWRNNVGALQDKSGRLVRYGLCNDSAAQNEKVKSSDLIGIRALTVTPEMVGQRVGQFLAREMKATDWTFSNTPEEQAQLAFINLVNAMGGDAKFSSYKEFF